MGELDDTVSWSNVVANEMADALSYAGIVHHETDVDRDGDVVISFGGLADAAALLSLVLTGSGGPGSLYDRATDSCVTLAEADSDMSEDEFRAATEAGWTWFVHPHMTGRRVEWDARVHIPAADASAVVATLNTLRNGGVL